MKTNDQLKIEFREYFKPLSEISIDNSQKDSPVAMVESDFKIINFDRVKEDSNNLLESCDGLFLHGEEAIFVEFKNGVIKYDCTDDTHACPNELCIKRQDSYVKTSNKLNTNKIWLKLSDSLILFFQKKDFPAGYLKENVRYILVYNEEKNPLVKIKRNVSKKAKQGIVLFGLSRYKKVIKDVKTFTKEEFVSFFLKEYDIALVPSPES